MIYEDGESQYICMSTRIVAGTRAVAVYTETQAVSADSSMSEISMDNDTLYPMYPSSTWSSRQLQTLSISRKICRKRSMPQRTSTSYPRYLGHCWRTLQPRQHRLERRKALVKFTISISTSSSASPISSVWAWGSRPTGR